MNLAKVVELALNGDAPNVDPAVRRALYSLAAQIDEQQRLEQARHDELRETIRQETAEIKEDISGELSQNRSEVEKVRRLLLGLTTSFIGAMLIGVSNILIGL